MPLISSVHPRPLAEFGFYSSACKPVPWLGAAHNGYDDVVVPGLTADLTVKIILNGTPRELPRPLSVAELLERLEISPRGVAVEVNLQLVPRGQHGQRQLADGDQLEIVTLVGGG